MSYYSAQARNGAYKPHNVTFATFAEGNPIEGKLSDFKTPETAHLWRDSRTPKLKNRPHRSKAELVAEAKAEAIRLQNSGDVDAILTRIEQRKAELALIPHDWQAVRLRKMQKTQWITFYTERDQFNKEGWFSVEDTAKKVGVHETTVRNWYYKKLLTKTRFSEQRQKAVYLWLEEVIEYKKKREMIFPYKGVKQ